MWYMNMKDRLGRIVVRYGVLLILGCVLCGVPVAGPGEDAVAGKEGDTIERPSTVEEARSRARILHETIHGALQIMHRDYFDPDDKHNIPSNSLEEVFEELARRSGVQIRWIGVNAKIMNKRHTPEDAFERRAATALASGNEEFEEIEKQRFRYAGAIPLHNVCLKCHVPYRTSLEDRTAGLVISVPLPQTD